MKKITAIQKITPFLWFNREAEQAATFYTSIFKNSRIIQVTRYGDAGPGKKESVMTVAFQLEGQAFTALNGGPAFKISPAISFVVSCETQKEIDSFWDKLSKGGKKIECGWVTDKFGVSWQIVPSILPQLINMDEPERTNRVMEALMKMRKLDLKKLKAAYAGK
jgi:predicted 3-demethylubiquinone-9 3-methyltransferase (glyoxalase superfamily)